jgi:hypothetical protein
MNWKFATRWGACTALHCLFVCCEGDVKVMYARHTSFLALVHEGSDGGAIVEWSEWVFETFHGPLFGLGG